MLFSPRLSKTALLLGLGAASLLAAPLRKIASAKLNSHYTVNTLINSKGVLIEEAIINGPPAPPPGFEVERQAALPVSPNPAAGINVLTVPAFDWMFGCSAVSGAMIAGYYDRNGFPNLYTGPTNGGVMPLDNSSWPTWWDGSATYPNCPLVASHDGVDGRAIRGSIDDYWVQYGSSAANPYITNGWTQHAWGDAVGDYMMTSQSAFGNTDGSTTFYTFASSPAPLTYDDMVANNITTDGTMGRKRFYEARGYACEACYNQKTDNTITGGFSFAQFKAEIDAGRPVMLNLMGHTVVGIGYDDASDLVYIHDTWDYSNHTMPWGGSYSGRALLSVSIVNVALPTFTSFSPTSGFAGAAVVLQGDFTGATAVSFNGTPAATFTVDSPTQITATVPPGATTGRIIVNTPAGNFQSPTNFTVFTFDLNGDGRIDLKDLARIARYFGTSRAADPSGFQVQYDLDGNGSIDEQDVTLLFGHLD